MRRLDCVLRVLCLWIGYIRLRTFSVYCYACMYVCCGIVVFTVLLFYACIWLLFLVVCAYRCGCVVDVCIFSLYGYVCCCCALIFSCV